MLLIAAICLSTITLARPDALDANTRGLDPWNLNTQKPAGFGAFLDANYKQAHIDPDWFYDCNNYVITQFCQQLDSNAGQEWQNKHNQGGVHLNRSVFDGWYWNTEARVRCQIGVYIPDNNNGDYPIANTCSKFILQPIIQAAAGLPDNKMNRWSINLAVMGGKDPFPDSDDKKHRIAVEDGKPSWIVQG